jgi:hypothetical protein
MVEHRVSSQEPVANACLSLSRRLLGGFVSGGMDGRRVLLFCRLGTLLVERRVNERNPLSQIRPNMPYRRVLGNSRMGPLDPKATFKVAPTNER